MEQIFYMPIDPSIDKDEFGNLCYFVSEEKQARIKRYASDIDKKLSLYSDLFIRLIVHRKFGISNDEIVFGRGKYGKPFILNFPEFYYNISRTRNAIAIALSCKDIGIDIERILNNQQKIAMRFFTADEYQYIYGDQTYQDRRFYEIWTKKEAYIKCVGKGLTMPLNSFTVLDSNSELKCQSFLIDNYMISFCLKHLSCENNLIEIKERKFIQEFKNVFDRQVHT